MKKSLLTLPLGLVLALAGQSAFALTGTIDFTGRIDSATCPIDVIDPITGHPGGPIVIGYAQTKDFPTSGSESVGKTFHLRLTPGGGCVVSGTSATVTFNGVHGGVGAGNALYALMPVANAATGIGVAIKDNLGALIPHGGTSRAYPISTSAASDMAFHAVYRSHQTAVTAGAATASINFTVNII